MYPLQRIGSNQVVLAINMRTAGTSNLITHWKGGLFSVRLFAKNQAPLLVMHEQLQRWYRMGIAKTTEVVSSLIDGRCLDLNTYTVFTDN